MRCIKEKGELPLRVTLCVNQKRGERNKQENVRRLKFFFF
jgi:hypothetical protein